jgi:cytochrome bd ubiquinol oxidase subunit II
MTWVTLLILFFLLASLLLYVLLGGADFGAGILEIFDGGRKPKAQRVISHAMAPVWEANHVWLILAVVILFMGFPTVYTTITTYLYLPVLALLMGIVGRGCAFTFRHYDTPSIRYRRLYTFVFALSSLGCALALGVIAGALMLGRVAPDAPVFLEVYVLSWFNTFCFATALFTACLFVFLAAVYLTGEAKEPEMKEWFIAAAARANVAVVLSGAVVFATAHYEGLPLMLNFFSRPFSAGAFVLATVLLVPLWRQLLGQANTLSVRVIGVAIVSLVLLGWYGVQYPVAFALPGQDASLTFAGTAAPAATQRALLGALLVGSLIIFPATFYLLGVFKWETLEQEPGDEGRS